MRLCGSVSLASSLQRLSFSISYDANRVIFPSCKLMPIYSLISSSLYRITGVHWMGIQSAIWLRESHCRPRSTAFCCDPGWQDWRSTVEADCRYWWTVGSGANPLPPFPLSLILKLFFLSPTVTHSLHPVLHPLSTLFSSQSLSVITLQSHFTLSLSLLGHF